MIIAILVIALVVLVGSIVYEETINIMYSANEEVEQNNPTKENEEISDDEQNNEQEDEQEDESTTETNTENI